ncbi:potassium channel, sub T, member 2 [Haplosporangium sp. Z 767]|nr:potassium channel, sub T, member 2 [Haplosporangium sp. Z 767]KAF9195735.1 potassium channel, sub T, member 2 [Haplosporangium sp. Z 11]
MFNGARQPHSILPITADAHRRPSLDLTWRSKIKDIPGQTTDPEDPLNRNLSSIRASREDLIRNGSRRSIMTAASATHNNSASISARRNQLQRQNSFGAPPNQFLAFIYWLKELTGPTDTTDEKTTSTVLNVFNVFVDTLFCMLYLVEASTLTRPAGYESHWMYIERDRSFWRFLVAIAAYNFLTVCCSILFAESRISSLRSVRHIISTLVALPFIFSIFIVDGHQLYVPYFLQSVALVSRVQQALNFYIDIGVSDVFLIPPRALDVDLPMDPLKSKSITFAMYIITLIYCAISAFQVAEYDQLLDSSDHNDLLKLLYFVLITMSTIGYGDLTPKNQLGYAIVVLIIITVITVFPWMISGIQDALAQAKAGEGMFKPGGNKFMIISGSLHSAQKLANVLNGFWFTNKEYSNSSFKIVILGLSEPSKDIQALLQSARYKNRVVYLKGTPLESKDLERIQARYAEGIFIIADRNSPFSPQEEDRHNTLSTLAFRNVSDAGIYTYNLLPETEIYQKMAATQVVCADELRQVLLAFNCLQQATATLILNMLHQRRPSDKIAEAWEAEYDDSIGNEFYTSYLNPIFDGKPFGFVSWFLYRRFQVILFGVRIRLQSGEYHTALNPGKDYRFQHNEQCIFIAQNPTDLDDINELSERHLNNFLEHLQQTQQEDEESIGADYHAKNFAAAIQSLSTTSHCGTARRKTKSKRSAMNINTCLPYTRRSGRYHLHSAIPTFISEDDDIDVEPEVCFVSGAEDSGAEQEENEPSSPRAQQPKMKANQERISSIIPDDDLDSGSRSDGAKSTLRGPLQSDGLSNVIVGYPPAPFPGAKVPLCMLVDPRFDGERTLSDMVIKSWAEVLQERQQRRTEEDVEGIDQANSADLLQTPGFEHDEEQNIFVSTSTSSEPVNTRSGIHSLKPSTDLGHILICSPNYDIFRLVCTLRSAHLKQLQDVVILCSREPTTQEFKVLKCFPRLYFLIGDCLLRDDLERGAITKSSKYLFMRHPENAGVDGSFFDSAAVINRILVQQIFSDAQIARASSLRGMRESDLMASTSGITISNSVYNPSRQSTLRAMPSKKPVSLQSLNEGPQCVYELVEERSVDFLQIRKTDIRVVRDGTGGPLEQFGPESDSGYYGFPEHASQRKKVNAETGVTDFYHNPIYASGGVLVGGLLDHVLYQLYSNPSILQLIKLLCGIRTKADIKRDYHLFKEYGAGCHLECIPVPEGFAVQTMRPTTGTVEEDQADHCSNGSNPSSKNSSDDEAEDDSNKRQRRDRPKSTFSRAASKGKKKISELFYQQYGSAGSSFDSDYMYDNRHMNFLHLYEYLALDQGVIPIGLLRRQGDDPKTVHLGIGGSSRCYAITNPLLDTIILDTDQVFVLTREKNV